MQDDDEAPGSGADDFDAVLRDLARADPRSVVGGVLADRFHVLSVAGRGGFGTVYRACDVQEGRDVALKVMRHGTTDVRRFEREATLLASLHHPSVVSYVAHGTTEHGAPFLVMEWLDGLDLARRLEHGRLSVRDALTIALHAAEGLAAAHALGAIHRDVKPTNLYLVGCSPDDLRVIDFGVARAPRSAASMTTTGAVMGTPAYMAPEQARGAKSLSAAVDVFGLGCVLFECLSGSPPFVEPSAPALVARLVAGDAPTLRERWPEAPSELDALLRRMLAMAPDERLPHGAAAAAAIGEVLPAHGSAEPIRSYATILAECAPWRSFPPEALALVARAGGEVLENAAGSMVARLVAQSPAEVCALGDAFTRALADQEPSVRVATATARGVAPPLMSAVKAQLAARRASEAKPRNPEGA